MWRPSSSATLTPAVKADIQAVTQGGTTTRPSAPMPRPAMSEAAMTWVPGESDGNMYSGRLSHSMARSDDVADHRAIAAPGGPTGRHG